MMNIHFPNDTGAALTDEQWLDGCRSYRNRLLAQSDWAMATDAPTDKQAWAEYRQALRDFPASWVPGPTADFPDPPA